MLDCIPTDFSITRNREYLACILKAQVLRTIAALHFHDTTSIHITYVRSCPGGGIVNEGHAMNEWAWRLLLLVMVALCCLCTLQCDLVPSSSSLPSLFDEALLGPLEALTPGNCTHQSPCLLRLTMKPGEKQASPLVCLLAALPFGLVQESQQHKPKMV